MSTSHLSRLVRDLRVAALAGVERGNPDGHLLESFVSRRDAAALGVLVRRHAPMVWGVCRRLLGHEQDAEDAFQATFLVLVRKAASVVPRERVGNWLYGVAYRTALKARTTRARRRGREMTAVVERPSTESEIWHDLRPVLDQELSRLPEKYRAAVVLCDLEGKSRAEAACELGIPEGTLSSRLGRGRAILAKRLAGRGVGLTGCLLGAILSENAASAAVPTQVVFAAVKAASHFATGQASPAGASTAATTFLVKGVLNAMLFSKVKAVAGILLAVGLIAVVAGHCFPRAAAGQPFDDQRTPKAARATAEQGRGPREKLDGVWKVFSIQDTDKNTVEFDPILSHACGIQAPVRAARFTFRGETFVLKTGPVSLEGRYAFDKTAPHRIVLSIVVELGDGTGLVGIPAVYSLDRDSLTILCSQIPPSQIAGLAGKAGVRYTLRRDAPSK
jgi:RNA polymerase sigma factor (sigma-70 family)